MTVTSRLGIAFIVVAVGLLVTSTGGVLTVTGTRNVDVETGRDATAYLGVERYDRVLTNGRHEDVVLLELRNNLPARLTTVTITVTDGHPRPPRSLSIDRPTTLAVGESRAVTADIVCGGRGDRTERWRIAIVATGTDSRITAARGVSIRCEPPVEPPDPPGPPDGAPGRNGPGTGASDTGDERKPMGSARGNPGSGGRAGR